MRYEVNLNIFGNVSVEVEAENLEDAKSKAAYKLIDIDFNALPQEVTVNYIRDETSEIWTEVHAREWVKFRNIFAERRDALIAARNEINQLNQKIEQLLEQQKQLNQEKFDISKKI